MATISEILEFFSLLLFWKVHRFLSCHKEYTVLENTNPKSLEMKGFHGIETGFIPARSIHPTNATLTSNKFRILDEKGPATFWLILDRNEGFVFCFIDGKFSIRQCSKTAPPSLPVQLQCLHPGCSKPHRHTFSRPGIDQSEVSTDELREWEVPYEPQERFQLS